MPMNPWIHGHLLRYHYMLRTRSLKMIEEKTEHKQRGFVDDFGTGACEMIQFGECAAGGNHSCPDGADRLVIRAARRSGDTRRGHGTLGAKPSAGTFGHSTHYGFRHGSIGFYNRHVDPEDIGFGFVGVCHCSTHVHVGTSGHEREMMGDVAAGAAFCGGDFESGLTEGVEQVGCDFL